MLVGSVVAVSVFAVGAGGLELVAESAQPTFPTHGPFLLPTGKPPPLAHYAAPASFPSQS